MMKAEFRQLRLKQLARTLEPFAQAREVVRPRRGWIRALREATGMTLKDVAGRLGGSLPLISKLEKSETEYAITLKSLRDIADAMDCQLVYALVPKTGDLDDLARRRATQEVAENVSAVEHTMALENQAVGGIDEKINEESERISKLGKRPK